MMIWVHGFLMPERGETETRIFFLMGNGSMDRRIDGRIDRSAKQQKQKSGPEGPQENSIFRPSVAAVRRNLCVRGGGGAGARRTRRWVHSRRVATIAAALVSRGRRIRTRRSRARFGTWRSVCRSRQGSARRTARRSARGGRGVGVHSRGLRGAPRSRTVR